MDAERKQLKSAVTTPDDNAKLQKYRDSLLPILPEFDENNEEQLLWKILWI